MATAVVAAAEAIGARGIDWSRVRCDPEDRMAGPTIRLTGFEDLPEGPAPVELVSGVGDDTMAVRVTVPYGDTGPGGPGGPVTPIAATGCPPELLDRLSDLVG